MLVENLSKFNKNFIKSYNEKNKEGYFINVGIKYPKILHELYDNLPFLPKLIKSKNLQITCEIKKYIYCEHQISKSSIISRINFGKNLKSLNLIKKLCLSQMLI